MLIPETEWPRSYQASLHHDLCGQLRHGREPDVFWHEPKSPKRLPSVVGAQHKLPIASPEPSVATGQSSSERHPLLGLIFELLAILDLAAFAFSKEWMRFVPCRVRRHQLTH